MAVKQSRAIELAKLAAEAAKAEVMESEAAALPPVQGPWQPANLQGFKLQPAMQNALVQVAGHLARALRYEGLDVVTSLEGDHPLSPKVTEKAQTPQKADISGAEAISTVHVQEGQGGRIVRGYSTPAVLGLFASQQQRNGIVVDGQI